MAGAKPSVFQSTALISGLVTQEQLDEAMAVLRNPVTGPPTPVVEVSDQQLAEQLVEMEVLTTYQAAQLENGRTKFDLGPYVITDFIGQGGMGQVYKAVHKVMGRVCAVKVLPQNKATPDAIKNFQREIRTQAQLDHPHLVRAYDAGEDGKVHYLVVEYVPGTDLRRLIRSQGAPLTTPQTAGIIMHAAHALEYAHERGLIHRDVKPGNILVTEEGVAKVSDLGLAGCIYDAENDPRLGKIVGTADYLAPETIRNPLSVSSLSDIYSLGCTLYYAVTGKVPFPGGSTADKARRHCEETPWHPRRFNAEISEEFVEIMADMMEKDPRQRIQTMAETAARLEPWADTTAPILSRRMSKSPWAPPPLPTGGDEDLADTGEHVFDLADASAASGGLSQISQGTSPVGSSTQETRLDPAPPAVIIAERDTSQTKLVLTVLAIAVPVSLACGCIFGIVLRSLFT